LVVDSVRSFFSSLAFSQNFFGTLIESLQKLGHHVSIDDVVDADDRLFGLRTLRRQTEKEFKIVKLLWFDAHRSGQSIAIPWCETGKCKLLE
jgi:hypothetical protein